MKQILTEFVINDDDYLDYGGDNMTLVKHIVGPELFYHGGVEFELEFIDRDWLQQTQTVQISIIGNHKSLTWFWLKYKP